MEGRRNPPQLSYPAPENKRKPSLDREIENLRAAEVLEVTNGRYVALAWVEYSILGTKSESLSSRSFWKYRRLLLVAADKPIYERSLR